MWRHWRLDRDPFAGPPAPFVPLEEHRRAVGRLLDSIESGRPLALLLGDGGVGKSTILRQTLTEARRADRRVVLVEAPLDAESLWGDLADRLEGRPRTASEGPSSAWRRLERAIRVSELQGRRPVLGVDDWDGGVDLGPIRRLGAMGRASVVASLRGDPEWAGTGTPWVRVAGLTRTDAEAYLAAKLAAAGAPDAIFTPRAVLRIQALARGTPREIDRLASLSLAEAAGRRLEAVPSEVVDAVAAESARGSGGFD